MKTSPAKEFIREVAANWQGISTLAQFRHFGRWVRSLGPEASSIADRMPWITYDAIELLEAHLTRDSTVFEYGAGGSTLFFLDRAACVFSVEHNPEWFARVQVAVSEVQRGRWKGFLCEPKADPLASRYQVCDPEGYISDDGIYLGKSFREYATAIERCKLSEFDVVLVDGRARPSCIMHSIDKVKLGGLLVVDNVEREYYLSKTAELIAGLYRPLLQTKGAVAYNSIFTKTAIWQRL